MPKPKVFIGSSTPALNVARSVKAQLNDVADVMVWRDLPGSKLLGKTIIEALFSILDDYDFALLIFAGDDTTSHNGDSKFVTRDNVVFELGLFMARLGRERTFIVKRRALNLKQQAILEGY